MRTVSDEIASACLDERRTNHSIMFGLKILEQRTLLGFFLCCPRNIHRLHGIRIESGIEHTGRDRTGRRIEILHLFGADTLLL